MLRSLLSVKPTVKDAMNQPVLALAVIFLAAIPTPASANQRCYQLTDLSLPPQVTPLSRTQTSCASTPTGACWHRVEAFPYNPPGYDLWLATPSSWDFGPYQFFDYLGDDSSGDPVVRWLYRLFPGSSGCNTQPPGYTLDVTLTGTGSGFVVSLPAGINCPAGNCSTSFRSGTLVTLTATPDANSTFTGWSGEGCSGTGTCIVTMARASSVTATFTAQEYFAGDWDGDGRSNLAVRRGSCVLMDYNFDGAADFTQCYSP